MPSRDAGQSELVSHQHDGSYAVEPLVSSSSIKTVSTYILSLSTSSRVGARG